jgi:Family of unknown function (DUF5678)
MSEPETFPAPVLGTTVPPPRNKWEREYRAFLQLLPQLLTAHRGQYVAVHDGQVVDSGDDEIALALRVYDKYGYVPLHIGRVVEQTPPERIPRYRILPTETA